MSVVPVIDPKIAKKARGKKKNAYEVIEKITEDLDETLKVLRQLKNGIRLKNTSREYQLELCDKAIALIEA